MNKFLQKRKVLQRVNDIVLLIGKWGLSYRGNKFESAYFLVDPLNDHGNFLGLVLLLSKYDEVLKTHVDKVIKESKRRHR